MQKVIDKANVLIEALPYIKKFNGITVVIKYGGSALINNEIKKTIIKDIALMKFVGFNPIIIHGGGPDINRMLDKMNIKSEFVNGLRITDEETMEVVEMVLAGKINKDITAQLNLEGIDAVGISGKDGKMLLAKKLMPGDKDIGYVGAIEKVNVDLISTMVKNNFVPVISPIGFDKDGNSYNINADYAASAIAAELRAEKLVFLTDVEGIRRDANDSDSVTSRMGIKEARKLIDNGVISGGMIPKVECCINGINNGVRNVHILDGRVRHSLILEIFTNEGIGTMIVK